MIHMPRRSVTRFFIPLIDVLILLFGIFLLMPLASEAERQDAMEASADQSEQVKVLERDLRNRMAELQKLDELRPDLEKVAELKRENEELRVQNRQALQQNLLVKVLEVDPKDGSLTYYDAARADAPLRRVESREAADDLIKQHRREAGDRQLYYQFLR